MLWSPWPRLCVLMASPPPRPAAPPRPPWGRRAVTVGFHLSAGTNFLRVIPDGGPAAQSPQNVRRVLFCTGKVYYDLTRERKARNMEADVAITRVEQVSPACRERSGRVEPTETGAGPCGCPPPAATSPFSPRSCRRSPSTSCRRKLRSTPTPSWCGARRSTRTRATTTTSNRACAPPSTAPSPCGKSRAGGRRGAALRSEPSQRPPTAVSLQVCGPGARSRPRHRQQEDAPDGAAAAARHRLQPGRLQGPGLSPPRPPRGRCSMRVALSVCLCLLLASRLRPQLHTLSTPRLASCVPPHRPPSAPWGGGAGTPTLGPRSPIGVGTPHPLPSASPRRGRDPPAGDGIPPTQWGLLSCRDVPPRAPKARGRGGVGGSRLSIRVLPALGCLRRGAGRAAAGGAGSGGTPHHRCAAHVRCQNGRL